MVKTAAIIRRMKAAKQECFDRPKAGRLQVVRDYAPDERRDLNAELPPKLGRLRPEWTLRKREPWMARVPTKGERPTQSAPEAAVRAELRVARQGTNSSRRRQRSAQWRSREILRTPVGSFRTSRGIEATQRVGMSKDDREGQRQAQESETVGVGRKI